MQSEIEFNFGTTSQLRLDIPHTSCVCLLWIQFICLIRISYPRRLLLAAIEAWDFLSSYIVMGWSSSLAVVHSSSYTILYFFSFNGSPSLSLRQFDCCCENFSFTQHCMEGIETETTTRHKRCSQHCCALLIILKVEMKRRSMCRAKFSFLVVGRIWQQSEYVVSWWNYLEFFHPSLFFSAVCLFVWEVKVQVTHMIYQIWMTSTFESDVMVN